MRRFSITIFALAVAAIATAKPAPPDWVMSVSSTPTPAYAAGAKAVVLLDEKSVTFDNTGEAVTRLRRVARILSADGMSLATVLAFSYDGNRLQSMHAWMTNNAGQWQTFRQRDAIEIASFGWELYSDTRAKAFRLPVQPGGIVAWETESRGRAPFMAVDWEFQDDVPVVTSRLALQLPDGWVAHPSWTRHEPVAPAGGVWELRDIRAVPSEKRMPAVRAVAARLDVDVLPSKTAPPRSWNDIAAWYSRLSAPSVSATSAELQNRARQLTEKSEDWMSKVRALARFAQHDVRYVAIEIGIGGYKPHPANEIFAHRFGDCKDKATLLRAMLREIGIESHDVVVNATPGVVADVPAISAFNHVIVAIRVPDGVAVNGDAVAGGLLYFDPTNPITPLGHLPPYLRGSRALLVTPDGGSLITLPPGSPQENRVQRIAKLRVIDGSITGDVDEVRTGSRADAIRNALHPLAADERTRYLEHLMTPVGADASVSALNVDGADDPYADLRIHYSISVRSAIARIGDMVLLRANTLRHDEEDAVDVRDRALPYITDGPTLSSEMVEIVLPESLAVDEVPKPMRLASSDVSYSCSYAHEGGVLRWTREYEVKTLSVPPASAAEFMSVISRIRADERNSVVLKQR